MTEDLVQKIGTDRVVTMDDTSLPPSDALDFYNFDCEQLTKLLTERFSAPRFTAVQLFQWVYKQEITDFSLMTNLGRDLRQKISQVFYFPKAKVRDRQISTDGTRKYLFELDQEAVIESVMIKQPKRMTLCVSSQVGCGMGCSFCRTATMGFRRNLTTSEIVRQVLGVSQDAKNFDDSFSNIVFMGMGEPLHNYRSVVSALKILKDANGLAIAPRRITISSVGLVPAIEKFGSAGVDVNIAISLNATTNQSRQAIMPITKAYPIEHLLQTLRNYPLKNRRKFTIEYVMLAGINDSEADLKRLPKLLNGIPSKVNLIPYNMNAGLGFQTPSLEWVRHWQNGLHQAGLDVTVRWSKGVDIDAACGQLAVQASANKNTSLAQIDLRQMTQSP